MIEIEELARLQGISVEEVREHIDQLVGTGWLTPVENDGGVVTYAMTIPQGAG